MSRGATSGGKRATELRVEVMAPGDPVQDRALEQFFDRCPGTFAQQTRGWRDVIRAVGAGDEPRFLGCWSDGDLVGVLPSYRFQGPLGAIQVSCAQAGALGGVACLDDARREAVYEALLSTFRSDARATGSALATVVTNPFWPDRDLCERYLEPSYVLENACQVLDLETAFDAEGGFARGSANLRRNLRKAHSGALVIDDAQSSENVEEWYTIHRQRHLEIGATPLPAALFRAALESMVPIGKARFFFVRHAESGEMVAGGVYLLHGRVIDALMPSFATRHARLAPNFLLADHSIRWARDLGLRYYNWQASPPASGVHRYKRQWGSDDVPYFFMTRVTGDVEPLRAADPGTLREAYPWHYVLPFDCVGPGARADARSSSRQSAWQAGEP